MGALVSRSKLHQAGLVDSDLCPWCRQETAGVAHLALRCQAPAMVACRRAFVDSPRLDGAPPELWKRLLRGIVSGTIELPVALSEYCLVPDLGARVD
eukprot:11292221-Alexandrium_andersonii.AAC.1